MTKLRAFIFLAAIALSLARCGGRNSGGNVTAENITSQEEGATRAGMQTISLSDSTINNIGADTVYMGRMRSGEVVTRTIGIANIAERPLVIIDVDKTCGCVDLTYPRQPLKPGEQSTIELSFDSRNLSGWVYKTLALKTSLGERDYLLVVTADIE